MMHMDADGHGHGHGEHSTDIHSSQGTGMAHLMHGQNTSQNIAASDAAVSHSVFVRLLAVALIFMAAECILKYPDLL